MSEAGGGTGRPRLAFDPVARAREHWRARGWEDAAPGMAAVTSVMRAQQIFLARVEAVLRPLGLTFARYEVLMLLGFTRAGALPLARIGERLQVHPASVTNAVDRLEAQGLVRRVPHPHDRRATLAELTPDGRATAAKATDALNEQVFGERVFTGLGLPPERVEALVDLLGHLRGAAGDF